MGVELPLHVVVTILECCVTFSGVKLSIRSFVLFILAYLFAFVVYSFSSKMSLTFIKELSKLIKEKYLGYILSIFVCFCCFLFFQEITFLLSE